jgi:hypothetical protein
MILRVEYTRPGFKYCFIHSILKAQFPHLPNVERVACIGIYPFLKY